MLVHKQRNRKLTMPKGHAASSARGQAVMPKGQTVQDPYLNILRKDHVPVSIFLVNGIKLQGQIVSFDQFVVILKNGVSQMIYKHAISTVLPSSDVRFSPGGFSDGDDDGDEEWNS